MVGRQGRTAGLPAPNGVQSVDWTNKQTENRNEELSDNFCLARRFFGKCSKRTAAGRRERSGAGGERRLIGHAGQIGRRLGAGHDGRR